MKQKIILKIIKDKCRCTLVEHLGIKVTYADDKKVVGIMEVNQKTSTPAGVLHGGASAAFAESLGSIGGQISAGMDKKVVGQQITANHIRPAAFGKIFGKAYIIHKGKRTQIWQINICNDTEQIVCLCTLTLAVL
jgi:1,4-dihydroxy-2-naphthoyl-CoA hydrolase